MATKIGFMRPGSVFGRRRARQATAARAGGRALRSRRCSAQIRARMISQVGSQPSRNAISSRIGILMSAWMSPHRLSVTSIQLRLANSTTTHREQHPEQGLQKLHASRPLGERARSRPEPRSSRTRVASSQARCTAPLRARHAPGTAGDGWGEMVLQTAHKIGLGAFVLLMGASLLAMRPHGRTRTSVAKSTAGASASSPSLSTGSRRDVDYRAARRPAAAS